MTAKRPQVAGSVGVPLAFILTGVAALACAVSWLTARPDLLAQYHYNQQIVAVTHLFVLGWIGSVVIGSMYQLVPVALETTLHKPRLARWHWLCHVTGFTGMVWNLSAWDMRKVSGFGAVLLLGVLLLIYNLGRTLRRVPRWNVTATAIAAALGWVGLAVLAGLTLALAKWAGSALPDQAGSGGWHRSLAAFVQGVGRFDAISAMHAHAHLGGIGFFIILIVGVSYKLVPMFTLSEVQSAKRAGWSVGLLNLGLASSFVLILSSSAWRIVGASLVALGLLVYGIELRAILRARKRRNMDWALRYFITAAALLTPVGLLGLALAWPGLALTPLTGQLENLYGFLGFVGVITLAILGMLYKIIPFLVWSSVYGRHVGRAQVPAFAELYSVPAQAFGYWTYGAGLLMTSAGIVVRHAPTLTLGGALLVLSVSTFIYNTGRMLLHFVRPDLKPFKIPTPAELRSA